MPELPEVETVRRGLQPAMESARFEHVVVRRPDLRFPFATDFVDRLEGTTVVRLTRRAKYLLAELSSGDVLVMHLGMSGSFRVATGGDGTDKEIGKDWAERYKAGVVGDFHFERGAPGKHDHVIFTMSSGAVVTFNDPRRFGSMQIFSAEELAAAALFSALGPEPLDTAFDAAILARACAGKRTAIKMALLDQGLVAGIGNIYACEALHRARLSPKRRASTLATRSGAPVERTRALTTAIKAVLLEAIDAGGSSLRDHRQASGEPGYFHHRFRVYDREGARCPRRSCTGVIRRIVQGGRSTFFCPVCQR